MTNTPADLFRKSVFFAPASWLDLQQVMLDFNADSPSLAIAALISMHKNNKGAVNACSIPHHSSR